MCAVIVDYNGGFIFFAAVQKFIILFNHVVEDSIKVRGNQKEQSKMDNQETQPTLDRRHRTKTNKTKNTTQKIYNNTGVKLVTVTVTTVIPRWRT